MSGLCREGCAGGGRGLSLPERMQIRVASPSNPLPPPSSPTRPCSTRKSAGRPSHPGRGPFPSLFPLPSDRLLAEPLLSRLKARGPGCRRGVGQGTGQGRAGQDTRLESVGRSRGPGQQAGGRCWNAHRLCRGGTGRVEADALAAGPPDTPPGLVQADGPVKPLARRATPAPHGRAAGAV